MSDTQLEVMTVGEALRLATEQLECAGVVNARRDARLLLAHAVGQPLERLFGYPERALTGKAFAAFRAMVTRRGLREPVSRVLGRRAFWGLDFAITRATLDPRPESESLVEAVLEHGVPRDAPLSILDLGTGSGCLLLALLSELPLAHGFGIDRDVEALAVAQANARALGLAGRAHFLAADWGTAVAGSWQVILSNPPYIKGTDIDGLAPEVARHDPRQALDGGHDGLDAYRTLATQIPRLAAPGGLIALELGLGQAAEVESLVVAAGLAPLARVKDLAGRDRCLLATRNA